MNITTIHCDCHGNSHCEKCGGTGLTSRHIVIHPKCGHNGCKGIMHPKDHRPGSVLKCNICNREFESNL